MCSRFRYNFLPITDCSGSSLRTGFRYNFLPIAACFRILSCVPDFGTTFFGLLLVSGSSLAYRISVHLSSDRRRSQILPDVPNFSTTFFRSLPVPTFSLRTGFRYNFLLIVAVPRFSLTYRIPVHLSSDYCLFPDPPCVPDSGTFFFRLLPPSRLFHAYRIPVQLSSDCCLFLNPLLRTGFRYNFLPIAAVPRCSLTYRISVQLSSDHRLFRIFPAYRIPVQLSSDCCLFLNPLLRTGFRYNFFPITTWFQFFSSYRIPIHFSSDHCLFPDPPCVPDSGTTFSQSLPGSSLRTGFRYIFLPVTASFRILPVYRIPVQLFSNHYLVLVLLCVTDSGTTFSRHYLFPVLLCVPDSGTTFFQSLPVSGSSLRTRFRYNFFPITTWFFSAYRIPVQLSSSHCLFPVLLCVPDFGTTFFQSLPLPGSSLRTGFRYNFFPITTWFWFFSAYRIPVHFFPNHCLFPDLLCVPDFGTAFFRSLPVPGSSLRTGFRYNFLPVSACFRFYSAYRISVQLSSDCCLFPGPPCVPNSGTSFF